MRLTVDSDKAIFRSILDSQISCSLRDICIDVEERANAYISLLRTKFYFLSKVQIFSLSTYVIHQLAYQERGIYLSKDLIKKSSKGCNALRDLRWMEARQLMECAGLMESFYVPPKFVERTRFSLSRVRETCLEDSQNYLRRVLECCLHYIFPLFVESTSWITDLFNRTEDTARKICEVYDTKCIPDAPNLSLFSLSPIIVACVSLIITLKEIGVEQCPKTKISSRELSSLIFKTYMDCLSYFCSCPISEQKKHRFFDICIQCLDLGRESIPFDYSLGETPKGYKDVIRSAEYFDFSMNINYDIKKKEGFPKSICNASNGIFECFKQRRFFLKYLSLYTKRKKMLRGNRRVHVNNVSFLGTEISDKELMLQYFNDASCLDQKRKLVAVTYDVTE